MRDKRDFEDMTVLFAKKIHNVSSETRNIISNFSKWTIPEIEISNTES
jgi:hypothetical protein